VVSGVYASVMCAHRITGWITSVFLLCSSFLIYSYTQVAGRNMLAAPHQNPRWSSVSPKESVFSVGTHDTEHVLMGKQEFEEVELDDGTHAGSHQAGDYTSNPRFRFCFLGLW
jgi:hypothetical protein